MKSAGKLPFALTLALLNATALTAGSEHIIVAEELLMQQMTQQVNHRITTLWLTLFAIFYLILGILRHRDWFYLWMLLLFATTALLIYFADGVLLPILNNSHYALLYLLLILHTLILIWLITSIYQSMRKGQEKLLYQRENLRSIVEKRTRELFKANQWQQKMVSRLSSDLIALIEILQCKSQPLFTSPPLPPEECKIQIGLLNETIRKELLFIDSILRQRDKKRLGMARKRGHIPAILLLEQLRRSMERVDPNLLGRIRIESVDEDTILIDHELVYYIINDILFFLIEQIDDSTSIQVSFRHHAVKSDTAVIEVRPKRALLLDHPLFQQKITEAESHLIASSATLHGRHDRDGRLETIELIMPWLNRLVLVTDPFIARRTLVAANLLQHCIDTIEAESVEELLESLVTLDGVDLILIAAEAAIQPSETIDPLSFIYELDGINSEKSIPSIIYYGTIASIRTIKAELDSAKIEGEIESLSISYLSIDPLTKSVEAIDQITNEIVRRIDGI